MVDPVFDIDFLPEIQPLIDGTLTLVLAARVPADNDKGDSPVYRFLMRHTETGEEMGGLNLRIGKTHNELHYRGNIGFSVHPPHRGHHYAERSCRLIAWIARHHGINPVWLTCNVDNIPSIRTLERLGEYVDTITMPDDYPYAPYYSREARSKRRYRWLVG
jgi:tagatose 1,6-diphosphate aldolase